VLADQSPEAALTELLARYRHFEAVAAETIDIADRIIAINCGTDTPKEWNAAFRKFANARAAVAAIARKDIP
jgi:hypothetical protein